MAGFQCPGCGRSCVVGEGQCPICKTSLFGPWIRSWPRGARYLLVGVGGLAGLVFVVLCGLAVILPGKPAEKPTTSIAPATPPITRPTDAQLDAALAAVKKRDKVLSAAWNNRTLPSLLVGVAGAGKSPHSYDRYARGMCGVLEAHGIKGAFVHVLDNFSDDWVELGKAECP